MFKADIFVINQPIFICFIKTAQLGFIFQYISYLKSVFR